MVIPKVIPFLAFSEGLAISKSYFSSLQWTAQSALAQLTSNDHKSKLLIAQLFERLASGKRVEKRKNR